MNRAEKLKTLQSALQGVSGQLEQVHREQRKKSAPYLEAHGIIYPQNCTPELFDLTVIHGVIDERPFLYSPLHDWLAKFNGRLQPEIYDGVAGTVIDANDSQYDAVVLSFVVVRSRNYSFWYLPGLTIGELRGLL